MLYIFMWKENWGWSLQKGRVSEGVIYVQLPDGVVILEDAGRFAL